MDLRCVPSSDNTSIGRHKPLADWPLDSPVAQRHDLDRAPALVLDTLADAATGRAGGAKVEAVDGGKLIQQLVRATCSTSA